MTQVPESGASQWASNHSAEAARSETLRRLGRELILATETGQPIPPVRHRVSGMSLDDAYLVQAHQLRHHLDKGRDLAGRKIGLTSQAMQAQLGVDSPDFGFFFSDMVHRHGADIPADTFISPKVEPELALVLGKPLRGPGVTLADARDAVATVLPALEIIDSRIRDWDITLVDTVADNASCGAVVLGDTPVDTDLERLREIPCTLRIDQSPRETGTGEAVMGDPVAPLAWLANVLGEHGEALEAGQVVLTGSFTRAVPVVKGETVTADFGSFGSLTVTFS